MNRDQRETARLTKKLIEQHRDGKIDLTHDPKYASSQKTSTTKPSTTSRRYTPNTTTPSSPQKPSTPVHSRREETQAPVQQRTQTYRKETASSTPSALYNTPQSKQESKQKANLFEEHFGCFLISVFIGAFIGALIAGIIFDWF